MILDQPSISAGYITYHLLSKPNGVIIFFALPAGDMMFCSLSMTAKVMIFSKQYKTADDIILFPISMTAGDGFFCSLFMTAQYILVCPPTKFCW